MPLDSDVQNPDANLHVEFYEKKIIEPVNLDIGRLEAVESVAVYCRIVVPGDKTFMHDQPVRQSDKERFPRHWLAFNMNRDTGGEVYGTPLKQWNMDDPVGFTESQLVEMQANRFKTVEQIAEANDTQIQRMGLGAEGLKIRARAYLDGRNRSNEAKELAETKNALAELQAQVAQLLGGKKPEPIRGFEDLGIPADQITTLSQEESDRIVAERRAAMTPAQERMAKARAARKVNVGGEQHAPAIGAASHG